MPGKNWAAVLQNIMQLWFSLHSSTAPGRIRGQNDQQLEEIDMWNFRCKDNESSMAWATIVLSEDWGQGYTGLTSLVFETLKQSNTERLHYIF